MLISIVLLCSASVYANNINGSTLDLFTPSEILKINEESNNSVNTNNINQSNINNINNTDNTDDSLRVNSNTNNVNYLLESDNTPQNLTINNTSNKINTSSNNSNSSIVNLSANKSNTIINVENNISNINTGGILAAGDNALFSLSKNDILAAAASLESHVTKYGTLPNYITIAKQNFSMSEFLYLLSKAVVNVNSGINSNITIKYIKDPLKPSGASINGNLYKNDYVDLAKRVSTFIEKNGISPNYGSSKLGSIQFQTLILGFSKVLEFTKIKNRLPNYVTLSVKSNSKLNTAIPKYNSSSQFATNNNSNNGNNPSINTSTNATNSSNNTSNNTGNNGTGSSSNITSKTVTLNDILDASARFKSYIETNKKLPTTITVGGTDYTLAQFLYLISTAIVNVNGKISSNIPVKNVKEATSPSGSTIKSNLVLKDYLDLAKRVSTFISQNGIAPNYGSSTLGKIKYQEMIYTFVKVLNYQKLNKVLPNYVGIDTKSFNTLLSSSTSTGNSNGTTPTSSLNSKYNGESLAKYLIDSANCQVSDAVIKSLAANITKGLTSDLAKATAIYNYVRDNINYNFYYNTKYGAKNTLNAKSGNCVDKSHLLTALSRASGLATRYVHGTATFTSGNTYGHVWTQILIGDTWVVADSTSSRNSFGVVNNWNPSTYVLHGYYSSLGF